MAHIRAGAQPHLRLRLPAARLIVWLLAAALAAAGCTPGADREPQDAAAPPPSAAPTETATAAQCPVPCRTRFRAVGAYPVDIAPEASGLAASRRNPGLLYLVDDGPGTTSLVVLRQRNARVIGRLHIQGLDGMDTEDLAVGRCGRNDRRWCVFIGDIGDNLSSRDSISVLRVREPDLEEGVPDAPVPAERIQLRYPRRPHDAETLMVDRRGRLLIVTKDAGRRGFGRARLFVAGRFTDGVLRNAGAVDVPQPAFPTASLVVGHVVTAGDARPGRVVLRTYDAVFEYRRPEGARRSMAQFAQWPVRELAAPDELQGEAIAYGADGCSLVSVSESDGALQRSVCR